MNFQPNSLAARDIASQLHPYTNLKTHQEDGPFIVTRGDGVYVYDDDGKPLKFVTGVIGKRGLKADTWYTLVDGKITEVED